MTGFAEQLIKKLVLDIVANLLRAPSQGGTPVDTGWARANWIPVLGRSSSRPTPQPGDAAQTKGAARQLTAQQEAAVAAIVIGYRIAKGKITIANNVPYIVRLDQGDSSQAGAGFVRRAIVRAIRVDLGGSL